jgi:LPPG:FO 2-phospho-L-lactate transferase
LRETKGTVAAVTPIVGGAPVAGPAGILMQSQKLPVSIAGVAEAYHDFLDLLIVDERDSAAAEELRKSGFNVQCTKTIMRTAEDKAELARTVVSLVSGTGTARAATDRQ